MSTLNEMILKNGLSFQCKKQLGSAGESSRLHIDISNQGNATNVQFDLDAFLCFADFVEDTRRKLLQGKDPAEKQ